MARNWKENSDVVQNRLDEFKAQRKHTRRSVLAGIAASSIIASVATIGINRIFPPNPKIGVKVDIGIDSGTWAGPETREKASLQIFRDFVSTFVNTDHDQNFWSTLDEFLKSAPEEELKKQIEGDITGRDGVLDVLWPKDIPINKHAEPIIRLALYQNIENASSEYARFEMRLTPEGRVNTFREASGKSEKIIDKPEEMERLLINVFKIDELKKAEGWITNYGKEGEVVGVTKVIQGENETITVSMSDYGYASLSIQDTYPDPLSPTPKPKNEA